MAPGTEFSKTAQANQVFLRLARDAREAETIPGDMLQNERAEAPAQS